MILTVGNSGVYEVEAFAEVKRILEERGQSVVLFKQDKCLESDGIFYEFSEKRGGELFLIIDGVQYSTDEFSSVWYLHPHIPKSLMNFEPAEYRQFIHRQFEELRRSLWILMRDKNWINDPWAVVSADNKIFQIQMASSVGFKVPNTLITSDPGMVRRFYLENEKNIVTKIFATSPMLNKVVYTNKVSELYMEKIDAVKQSPCIFQRLVEKSYELRITVVGDKIFPAKIYSQDDQSTATDWRKKPKLNDFEVKIEATELPEELKNKILVFMKKMNLRFGCLDFIVTPLNEYVFLEVNPSGQWYFVQTKTHLQIANAIADLLSEENNKAGK